MSGSNALLSLLSQDDFTKLKQDIHNHIDKMGGKIEEIAASDEEDGEDRAHTIESGRNISKISEDDDDVILTSYRGRRPGTSGRTNPPSAGNSKKSNNNTTK